MSRRKILLVAGARPNFMKIAPLAEALGASPRFEPLLVHTGQHYDKEMSQLFFDELGMPRPHRSLGVGSDTHGRQTARIMERLEEVMIQESPEAIVVVGDVNSTLAGALVAAKLLIPVAHVEAGLRSFDRTMPEEINRVVTDQLSRWLFTPSPEAEGNLLKEGIAKEKIHFVGNVMIDTLMRFLPRLESAGTLGALGVEPGGYLLVTLHRPSNVDDPDRLRRIVAALAEVAATLTVLFPVHPRTRRRMEEAGIDQRDRGGLRFLPPLGYREFMALLKSCRSALTDSGGIQEETTVLGVPCLTFRPGTERPVTVTSGTNRILGTDPAAIAGAVADLVREGPPAPKPPPPLWDGRAAGRIAAVLERDLLSDRREG
jgi:UDP-N-acetylglucosamine 2-epimerase (non-hydrolysing)